MCSIDDDLFIALVPVDGECTFAHKKIGKSIEKVYPRNREKHFIRLGNCQQYLSSTKWCANAIIYGNRLPHMRLRCNRKKIDAVHRIEAIVHETSSRDEAVVQQTIENSIRLKWSISMKSNHNKKIVL